MSAAMSSPGQSVNGKGDTGLNSENVRQTGRMTGSEYSSPKEQQPPYISVQPNPSQRNPNTGVASPPAHLHPSRDSKLRSRGQTASPNSNKPVLVREYSGNASSMNRSAFARTRPPRPHRTQDESNNPPPTSAFSFEDIFAAIQPEIQSSIDAIAEACGRNKLSLANEYDSHLPPHGALGLSPVLGEHTNSPNIPPVPRLEPVEESSSIAEGSATVNSESDQVDHQAYSRHLRSWSLLAASNADGKRHARPTSDVQTVTRKATSTAQLTSLDLRSLEHPAFDAENIPEASPQPDSNTSLLSRVATDYSFRHADGRSSAADTLNRVLGKASSVTNA